MDLVEGIKDLDTTLPDSQICMHKSMNEYEVVHNWLVVKDPEVMTPLHKCNAAQ